MSFEVLTKRNMDRNASKAYSVLYVDSVSDSAGSAALVRNGCIL